VTSAAIVYRRCEPAMDGQDQRGLGLLFVWQANPEYVIKIVNGRHRRVVYDYCYLGFNLAKDACRKTGK